MSKLGSAPDLRLVRTARIRFHEHPEHRRTLRLVERVRREKILRNPPIVAELDAERLLLLDGANRVSAFVELGYSHIPVQVIDYADPAIELKGWHHLLLEGHVLDLAGAYRKIPGVHVRRVQKEELERLLELRRVYAVLVDEAATCWGLFPQTGARFDVYEWIHTLDRVIAAYEGKAELERIKMPDYSNLPHVFDTMEHQLCLFPLLSKSELIELADAAIRIPTGITRHLVPGRALNLNIGLDFLTEMQGEEARAAYFARFIDSLEVEGRIRFYEEAVFILNE
ncbi:MAG: hypothetical protein JSW67_10800 [Candidatus Latescibacterota bacterium]|nr:MAG: hypothetical protein JSW67_10800 [Candidatus Latescibacterota bacterium]